MNLIIYTNSHYEEECALFDLDTNEVIMSGDWYHTKMSARIDGYLDALIDHKIYNKEVPEEEIDRTHEHYKLLEFYDEEGDEW